MPDSTLNPPGIKSPLESIELYFKQTIAMSNIPVLKMRLQTFRIIWGGGGFLDDASLCEDPIRTAVAILCGIRIHNPDASASSSKEFSNFFWVPQLLARRLIWLILPVYAIIHPHPPPPPNPTQSIGGQSFNFGLLAAQLFQVLIRRVGRQPADVEICPRQLLGGSWRTARAAVGSSATAATAAAAAASTAGAPGAPAGRIVVRSLVTVGAARAAVGSRHAALRLHFQINFFFFSNNRKHSIRILRARETFSSPSWKRGRAFQGSHDTATSG